MFWLLPCAGPQELSFQLLPRWTASPEGPASASPEQRKGWAGSMVSAAAAYCLPCICSAAAMNLRASCLLCPQHVLQALLKNAFKSNGPVVIAAMSSGQKNGSMAQGYESCRVAYLTVNGEVASCLCFVTVQGFPLVGPCKRACALESRLLAQPCLRTPLPSSMYAKHAAKTLCGRGSSRRCNSDLGFTAAHACVPAGGVPGHSARQASRWFQQAAAQPPGALPVPADQA